MRGLRVHITGSAARNCAGDLLRSAHSFIAPLADEIISRGGGLILGAGGEPRGKAGEPCIFDWTALAAITSTPDPAPDWPPLRSQRFIVVSTQSGLERIPVAHRDVWERFCIRSDVDVDVAPPGWRMAGIIRDRQVRRGDILVALGGGAGVENLAQSYVAEGKPVIPISTDLGSYSEDGSGGSRMLHVQAVSNPNSFFRLKKGSGSPSGRLLSLKLETKTSARALASDVVRLLSDLQPPTAFYVRLLDTSHADFPDVEEFFRNVVDPVVTKKGYCPDEIGGRPPKAAFINVDIFRSLHVAGLVVVDLTGVRPNCTMELGYALARQKRVIITAREGISLPFDPDKLPTHLWRTGMSTSDRIASFDRWFDRYYELPPLLE
jgi:hypothetical protein